MGFWDDFGKQLGDIGKKIQSGVKDLDLREKTADLGKQIEDAVEKVKHSDQAAAIAEQTQKALNKIEKMGQALGDKIQDGVAAVQDAIGRPKHQNGSKSTARSTVAEQDAGESVAAESQAQVPHTTESSGGAEQASASRAPQHALPDVQQIYLSQSGNSVRIEPGEYEGPLEIDRQCTVEADGATIWHTTGPAVIVSAPGVTLRGLRAEVVRDSPGAAGIAIQTTAGDTVLDDVEVRGSLAGFAAEEGELLVPHVVHLGDVPSGLCSSQSIDISLPAGGRVSCASDQLRVTPETLPAGRSTVRIDVAPLAPDVVLYTEILIETTVRRRIYVQGRAAAGA